MINSLYNVKFTNLKAQEIYDFYNNSLENLSTHSKERLTMAKVFVVIQYEKGREDGLVEINTATTIYNEARKHADILFAKHSKEYDIYIDTYENHMLTNQEKFSEDE